MAGLTKDELKQALVSHGVEQNLSAAKKDELVQLYEEFVAPHEENAGEFSSEDESLSPTKISSKRISRRSSAKVSSTNLRLSPKLSAKGGSPRVSATAALPKSPRVSSKSNGEVEPEAVVNVEELNDSALREQLTEHGVVVGPIVGKLIAACPNLFCLLLLTFKSMFCLVYWTYFKSSLLSQT